MRDDAVLRYAFAGRHFPFIGRRLDQHFTRGGAALAHIFVRLADAAAAAGRHVAPHALACHVLPGRGIFGRNLRPVAFQLLGHQLGEPGQRALSHLGAGDADHDGVVRADHHPGGHLGRAVRRANDLRSAERNVEPKCQSASGGRGTHHELAAINCRHIRHGCLPPHALAAAAWIAARTC